jgi:hypothetical protein
MAWKCSECGLDNPVASSRCCDGCGFIRYGALTLVGPSAGPGITATVDTDIGRPLLAKEAGEEAIFASPRQFRLVKDAALRSWAIVHAREARNPTYLNGAPLGEAPSALSDGDTVSIGPEKAKLAVRIQG